MTEDNPIVCTFLTRIFCHLGEESLNLKTATQTLATAHGVRWGDPMNPSGDEALSELRRTQLFPARITVRKDGSYNVEMIHEEDLLRREEPWAPLAPGLVSKDEWKQRLSFLASLLRRRVQSYRIVVDHYDMAIVVSSRISNAVGAISAVEPLDAPATFKVQMEAVPFKGTLAEVREQQMAQNDILEALEMAELFMGGLTFRAE